MHGVSLRSVHDMRDMPTACYDACRFVELEADPPEPHMMAAAGAAPPVRGALARVPSVGRKRSGGDVGAPLQGARGPFPGANTMQAVAQLQQAVEVPGYNPGLAPQAARKLRVSKGGE